MKFSEKWLREWVQPKLDSTELMEQLTLLGLEVDGMQAAAGDFSDVVVGEIVEIDAHPNADKLRICQVQAGHEKLQIVCGAPNARLGLKAPLALIGAVLPGDFKIKKSKLRGVESFGMLCSEKELGLSDESDGLMELGQHSQNGTNIRELYQLDDTIIDIDLTPNRADCFCIKGIAREVASKNQLSLKQPVIEPVKPEIEDVLTVDVQASGACPRYLTRIIKGIDRNAVVPLWMSEKLRRSGIRCIHPVVDITNYVMLELGQPMHAFDLGKIDGGITVRMAKPKEKVKLLGGQDVELNEKYLVITDNSTILAIAGVIGGYDSGVNEQTCDIVLESAYFDPATIMGKSRALGLHTDSSLRFERGVDPDLQLMALERATALIQEICGGQVSLVSENVNAPGLPERNKINLSRKRLDQVLGFSIPDEKVEGILEYLGMQPKKKATGWQINTPSWRFDIEIAEDIIEEIARLNGYDQIPLSALRSEQNIHSVNESRKPEKAIHVALNQMGYQEVINYAFVAEKSLQTLNALHNVVPLSNPLNHDMAVMRTTLLSGVLMNVKHNLDRQFADLSLYENGIVFEKTGAQVTEKEHLLMVRSGRRFPEQWSAADDAVDFYDIKGDVESLLSINSYRFGTSSLSFLHPGRQVSIQALDDNGQAVNHGWIGQLHPLVAQSLKIKQDVYVAQLDTAYVREQLVPLWQPTSKFPQVRRDLSIVLRENISWKDIKYGLEATVNDSGQSLVDVVLFDVYRGNSIDSGYKSLSIGMIFQEKNRTLEDKEVDSKVSDAVSFLTTKFKAEIRGGQ